MKTEIANVMKIVHRLLVLALLAAPVHLQASNPKVDSLLHLLETHTATDRAEVLWAVAYELFDVDNPQAVFYAERAYHEVWQKGDSLQIVKVGTTYVQLERRMGNLQNAINAADKLLPVARRNNYRKYIKMLLNTMGSLYLSKEAYDKALDLYYESLDMRRSDGDSLEVAIALANIGYLHYRLDDFEQAIRIINLGLAMKNIETKPDQVKYSYGNLGSAYGELRQYPLAIYYFHKAISMELAGSDQSMLAQHYHGLARIYFRLNALDSTEHYASLAAQVAFKRQDIWPLTFAYVYLSKIALKRHRVGLSEQYFYKANDLASRSEFPYLKLEVLRLKAALLTRTSPQEAIDLFDKYTSGIDSLYHGEAENRLRKVQLANKQRENMNKIRNQASVLALQSELLTRQRSFLLIVCGLLLLVAVLALELFRAYKKKESMNRLLDTRVAERTVELGLQRDYLQHHLDEEKIIKSKVYVEVDRHVKTLQGLLHLGQIDQGEISGYLEKATVVSNEIINSVSRLRRKEN